MNRKSGGQAGLIGDRRGGVGVGVVGGGRGRVESDNEDLDESGLSDDEDEQVRALSAALAVSSQLPLFDPRPLVFDLP